MTGGVVVLTGGVGGAKLVDGLYRVLPPGELTATVNTGDDFTHLGLPISPDIDSLLYLLSGQANQKLGWGREGESWNFMAALRTLGGPGWFNLGDGDLALHVLRGHALRSGETLSAVTARFAAAWSLDLAIHPMCESPVATWLDTEEGQLPFQDYFVARQCRPIVRAVRYEGAAHAKPPPAVIEALDTARAIIIAPSNPWLSVDPILAMSPPFKRQLQLVDRSCPACLPYRRWCKGAAVKGPTAKLMGELGPDCEQCKRSPTIMRGLIDGLLDPHRRRCATEVLPVASADTMMHAPSEDRCRVAQAALDLSACGYARVTLLDGGRAAENQRRRASHA